MAKCRLWVYNAEKFFVASGHPFAPVIRRTKRNSKKVYFWDTLVHTAHRRPGNVHLFGTDAHIWAHLYLKIFSQIMWPHSLSLFQSRLKNGWRRGGFFKIVIEQLEVVASSDLVDRPTQLICISDIYLSTDKYKGHSRAIWSDSNKTNLALITSSAHPPPPPHTFSREAARSRGRPLFCLLMNCNVLSAHLLPPPLAQAIKRGTYCFKLL